MQKKIAVLGDSTTTGGSIITASNRSFDGSNGMATVGSNVYCPKCKTVGTIIEGVDTFIVDDKAVAYDGSLVACQCSPVGINRVIALKSSMFVDVKNRFEPLSGFSSSLSTPSKNDNISIQEQELIRINANHLRQCADELCKKHLYHFDVQLDFEADIKNFTDSIVYRVDNGTLTYQEGLEAIQEEEKSLFNQSSEWLTRGLSIFGGVGLISAGTAMCTTGVGCIIGSYLVAHGANSIQEGVTGEDGFLKSAYQETANLIGGEKEYGDLVYNIADLTLSGYGLLKLVPKIDKFTNTTKFKLWYYGKQDLERAYKQMSKLGLYAEIFNDGYTVDTIRENIKNLVLIDKKSNEIAISIKEPEKISNIRQLVDTCEYVTVVTDDNNPANKEYYECTKPSGEMYKIYQRNSYGE